MNPEFKRLATLIDDKNINYLPIFEVEEKGSHTGSLPHSIFRKCLQRIDPTLISESAIFSLSQLCNAPPIPRPDGTNEPAFNYQTFHTFITEFKRHRVALNMFFERLVKQMQLGRNFLFKDLDRADSVPQGLESSIPMELFVSIYAKNIGVEPIPSDRDAILYMYDKGDRQNIFYRKLEADFKEYLTKNKLNYEELASISNFDQNPQKYWGKKIFSCFDNFFLKNQIIDPLKFFDEFGRNAERNTVSRYAFHDAVKRVIPNLPEDEYTKLERDLETPNREAVNLGKFVTMLNELRKIGMLAEQKVDPYGSKVGLTKLMWLFMMLIEFQFSTEYASISYRKESHSRKN